jgi:hypothetical protein
MEKEIKSDIASFWFSNGILYSKFKEGLNINLITAKRLIEMRHEISNEKKQYWCYDTQGVKSYPKESRDYSEIHGQDYLHAAAIVVRSHITIFMFNAFSKINKPKIPFKAFRTEEDAVAWLRKIKSDNEAKGIF